MATQLTTARNKTLHALLAAQLNMDVEPSIEHAKEVDVAKRNDYDVLLQVLKLADDMIEDTEGHQKYHAHVSYAETLSFEATAALPCLKPLPGECSQLHTGIDG